MRLPGADPALRNGHQRRDDASGLPSGVVTRASVVIVLGSVPGGGLNGELWASRGLNPLAERLNAASDRGEAALHRGLRQGLHGLLRRAADDLGAIQNGLTADFQLLAIKAALDGFAATRVRVGARLVSGSRCRRSSCIRERSHSARRRCAKSLMAVTVASLTAAVGVLILGIGFRLLDLVPVRVADLLRALVRAPLTLASVMRMH